MLSLVAVIVCFCCAALVVRLMTGSAVMSSEPIADDGRFLLDGIFPLVLAIPIAVTVLWGGPDVRAGGDLAFASFAGVALLTSAVVGLRGQGLDRERAIRWLAPVLVVGVAGGVLLMLAILGRLSIAVGQACFAGAIVLLWLNTPDRPASGPHDPEGPEGHHLVLKLLGLVVIEVVVAGVVDPPWRPVVAGIALLQAVVSVLLVSIQGGQGTTTLRLGTWIGGYGVLSALGLLSMRVVVRATLGPVFDQRGADVVLASGAGVGMAAVAGAASMLVGVPLLVAAIFWGGPGWRIAAGACAVIGVVALVLDRGMAW